LNRDRIRLKVDTMFDQLMAEVQREAGIKAEELTKTPHWDAVKARIVDWLDLYVQRRMS